MDTRADRVLALLSTGATDEAIARQLGVSLRTVQRDVRAILDRLGARTRFQAGQLLGAHHRIPMIDGGWAGRNPVDDRTRPPKDRRMEPQATQTSVEVRAYAPEDWPAICRVHDAARMQELAASVGVEAFLTLEQTAEAEGLFDDQVWVGVVGGEVVGFAAYAEDELTWIYVDPPSQGRGVGRALLRHALAHADALGVEVVETTVLDGNNARALYESEGFVLRETRTGSLVGNEAFAATGHILERRSR